MLLHSTTFKIAAIVTAVMAVALLTNAAVMYLKAPPPEKMRAFVENTDPNPALGKAGDLWVKTGSTPEQQTLHIRDAQGWLPFGEVTTAARGSMWYHGVGVPTAGEPEGLLAGDRYLDVQTNHVYEAGAGGVWALVTNITGADGTADVEGDIQWFTGEGVPDANPADNINLNPTPENPAQFEDGDHYLNLSSTPHTVYSFDTGAGAWGLKGQWAGPDGADADAAVTTYTGALTSYWPSVAANAGDWHVDQGVATFPVHQKPAGLGATDWGTTPPNATDPVGFLGGVPGAENIVSGTTWHNIADATVDITNVPATVLPHDFVMDDANRLRGTAAGYVGGTLARSWAGDAVQLLKGDGVLTITPDPSQNAAAPTAYIPAAAVLQEVPPLYNAYGFIESTASESVRMSAVAACYRADLVSSLLEFGGNSTALTTTVAGPGLDVSSAGGVVTVEGDRLLPAALPGGSMALLHHGQAVLIREGGFDKTGPLSAAVSTDAGALQWRSCPAFAQDQNTVFVDTTESQFLAPYPKTLSTTVVGSTATVTGADVVAFRRTDPATAASVKVANKNGTQLAATGAGLTQFIPVFGSNAALSATVDGVETLNEGGDWTDVGATTELELSGLGASDPTTETDIVSWLELNDNARVREPEVGPGFVTMFHTANTVHAFGHVPDHLHGLASVPIAPRVGLWVNRWFSGVTAGNSPSFRGLDRQPTQYAQTGDVFYQCVQPTQLEQTIALDMWNADAAFAHSTIAAMQASDRVMTWVVDMSSVMNTANATEPARFLEEPFPFLIRIPAVRAAGRSICMKHRVLVVGQQTWAPDPTAESTSLVLWKLQGGVPTQVTNPSMTFTRSTNQYVDVTLEVTSVDGVGDRGAYLLLVLWRGQVHLAHAGQVNNTVANGAAQPCPTMAADLNLRTITATNSITPAPVSQDGEPAYTGFTGASVQYIMPGNPWLLDLFDNRACNMVTTYGGRRLELHTNGVGASTATTATATATSGALSSNYTYATRLAINPDLYARLATEGGVSHRLPPSTSACVPTLGLPAQQTLVPTTEAAAECGTFDGRTTVHDLSNRVPLVLPTAASVFI